MKKLSELGVDDIPFGDEHDVRGRATETSQYWTTA